MRSAHQLSYSTPCDEDGIPLLNPKAPPIAQIYQQDDKMPYRDCIAFEFTVFLFQRKQMSIGNIDILLHLWATSLAQHDDSPPFLNHQDLYNVINATSIGVVLWQLANLSYDRPLPSQPPPWMQSGYTIWFRDPQLLFKSMLEIQISLIHLTTGHINSTIPGEVVPMNTLCLEIGPGIKRYNFFLVLCTSTDECLGYHCRRSWKLWYNVCTHHTWEW